MNTRYFSTLFAAVAVAACGSQPALDVPRELAPAAGEAPSIVVHARGVQIYECRASASATGGAAWAFVAPEADLFDTRGRPFGSHGAGPVWTAPDGSAVRGTVKSRADAPVAGAIPWLLLATQSSGKDGLFSKVTSIQRVNTAGGTAPAKGCDAASIGMSTRVAYTADYVLFTRATAGA